MYMYPHTTYVCHVEECNAKKLPGHPAQIQSPTFPLSHILPSVLGPPLPMSLCSIVVNFNDFPHTLSLSLTFFSFFLKFSPQVVGFSESCVGLGKLNLTKKL